MSTISTSNLRALVVDDNAKSRLFAKTILGSLGIVDVDLAENGEQALAVLETRFYDFVVSDWNMAPINGCELLNSLPKLSRVSNRDVPILLVTAYADAKYVQYAMKQGVRFMVPKPYAPSQLYEQIDRAMQQPRAQGRKSAKADGRAAPDASDCVELDG
ncbi:MAG: response regulator [Minwuiales bacterium]|nr:response regulator [Minwuiales bacterium]